MDTTANNHSVGQLDPEKPESVNFHMTRHCNYACKFCFHTSKTSSNISFNEAKRGLKKLAEAGMEKINFSGGEPFLVKLSKDEEKALNTGDGNALPKYGSYLGELCKYCRDELNLKHVTIVTNGSKITNRWMITYSKYVDIIAISCDSFIRSTNEEHGRKETGVRSSEPQERLVFQIARWCRDYDVGFKVNTVITAKNYDEDMRKNITELNPVRWKVFRALSIDGENAGEGAKRNVEPLLPSDQEWEHFMDTHARFSTPKPTFEDNDTMRDSYHILDEDMCFLNCENGGKEKTNSILRVSVAAAMGQKHFDARNFKKRDGDFYKKPSQDIEHPSPSCSDEDQDQDHGGQSAVKRLLAPIRKLREQLEQYIHDSAIADFRKQLDDMYQWYDGENYRDTTNYDINVVVVEGLDGVGKSTLVERIRKENKCVTTTASPQAHLSNIRRVLEEAGDETITRNFFKATNMLVLHHIVTSTPRNGPVWLVDRWFPSTLAFGGATELKNSKKKMSAIKASLGRNPWYKDILAIHHSVHITVVLLTLNENDRAKRVDQRDVPNTMEEDELKTERVFRDNVLDLYRASLPEPSARTGSIELDVTGMDESRVVEEVKKWVSDLDGK